MFIDIYTVAPDTIDVKVHHIGNQQINVMLIIKKNRAFVNLGLTLNRFKRRGDSFIFVTAHVLETQNLY